jgi:hypothetical protein
MSGIKKDTVSILMEMIDLKFLTKYELDELADLARYNRHKKHILEVCKSKIKYKTEHDAIRASFELTAIYNTPHRWYVCPKRKGRKHWHLTTH